MSRLGKLKRQAIHEANIRVLGEQVFGKKKREREEAAAKEEEYHQRKSKGAEEVNKKKQELENFKSTFSIDYFKNKPTGTVNQGVTNLWYGGINKLNDIIFPNFVHLYGDEDEPEETRPSIAIQNYMSAGYYYDPQKREKINLTPGINYMPHYYKDGQRIGGRGHKPSQWIRYEYKPEEETVYMYDKDNNVFKFDEIKYGEGF